MDAKKKRLDKRIKELTGHALPHWTLHDLRRTFHSGLGKLGIPPHIAERALNHAKGGIEEIYDRFNYEPQMRAAFEQWADHVLALVEGRKSNVVPMQRA